MTTTPSSRHSRGLLPWTPALEKCHLGLSPTVGGQRRMQACHRPRPHHREAHLRKTPWHLDHQPGARRLVLETGSGLKRTGVSVGRSLSISVETRPTTRREQEERSPAYLRGAATAATLAATSPPPLPLLPSSCFFVPFPPPFHFKGL